MIHKCMLALVCTRGMHWAKSRISFVDTCLKFYRHVLKLISLNSLTHFLTQHISLHISLPIPNKYPYPTSDISFVCFWYNSTHEISTSCPVTVGHQLDGISCTCRIHTKRWHSLCMYVQYYIMSRAYNYTPLARWALHLLYTFCAIIIRFIIIITYLHNDNDNDKKIKHPQNIHNNKNTLIIITN